jgi:hypothetical protein
MAKTHKNSGVSQWGFDSLKIDILEKSIPIFKKIGISKEPAYIVSKVAKPV